MSRLGYRTRRSANVKAKIHDKDECYQCHSWDSGQVEGLQIQLKAQIHFVINSPDELCYPIWCQIWSKPHSLGQCIVPGLSQGVQGTLTYTRSESKRVQGTLYMYQVTIYSSKCARYQSKSKSPGHSLHIPGHSSHSSRCTRSEQTVQGTVKLHQV